MSVQGYIGEPAPVSRYSVANNITGKANVISVAAARTLSASESGSLISVSQAAAYAITLPTAAAGLKYTFILTAANTNPVTIVTASSANVIYGVLLMPTGNVVADTGGDTITFASGAVVGDQVVLECADGTNWALTAFTGVNGKITSTTAS
jgi:hypothetical protein